MTKQEINKKAICKEMYSNSKEQNDILRKLTPSTPLSYEANQRLHTLIARYNELQNILKPPSKMSSIKMKSDEQQDTPGTLLEAVTRGTYCASCGAPDNHNIMNDKPWCFKCNKPLILTHKKPPQKPNPKLKGITVEDQEQFFLRQKQLGLSA